VNWFIAYIPRLWTRQKPDGKRGWGALRYLVFGLAFTLAGIWCINRLQNGGANARAQAMFGTGGRKSNPAAGNVVLKEVAQAAQDMRRPNIETKSPDSLASSELGLRVDQASSKPPPSTQSKNTPDSGLGLGTDNLESAISSAAVTDPAKPIDTSADSIFTALARSDQTAGTDGRPGVLDETDSSGRSSPAGNKKNFGRNGFLEPNLAWANQSTGEKNQLPSIESLVVKDSKAPSAATNPTESSVALDPAPNDRKLPRGEIIPVYIMQTVESGKFPTLVEFAVAKTIWFNGKPVIPFGTRFTASAGLGVRDRLSFNVDALRRRDGLEIACNGIILGQDKASGMQAYFIPPPAMVQAAPYIGSFLQAYADIMKLRATPTSVQIGSVGLTTQRPNSELMQEAVVSSAAQAMTDFMASQLTELKERYASYLTIPAGSFGYVQLTTNGNFAALWDVTQRGVVKTVGKPEVISTESVYAKRDEERAKNLSLSALAASVIESRNAPPSSVSAINPALNTPAAPGLPAKAIKDPFSN